MKKLLLLLLFPALVFSQELQYAEFINNLTKNQVRQISDDIMSFYTVPQKYYASTKNRERQYFIVYYPADLPEDMIKEDLQNGQCNLCNAVEFRKYVKGGNNDLGIEGVEVFQFKQVSGKYLDLVGWWQKHFAPKSTKESLLDKDISLRYIEDRNKNINLRFVKNFDEWEIKNAY